MGITRLPNPLRSTPPKDILKVGEGWGGGHGHQVPRGLGFGDWGLGIGALAPSIVSKKHIHGLGLRDFVDNN